MNLTDGKTFPMFLKKLAKTRVNKKNHVTQSDRYRKL